MRFATLHKLATYAMTLSAAAALLTGSGVALTTRIGALVAIVASFFFESRSAPARWRHLAWNIATLAFFVAQIIRVVAGHAILDAGIDFLLFVLVNKLFNRHGSRDYLQIHVLTFLMLVAATTVNTGLSYGLFFLLYVLCATWALALFHLRREIEHLGGSARVAGASPKRRLLDSRRLVGRAFALQTSAVSIGVILGATLLFVFFPRIGFGLFATQKRDNVAMTGFSDYVQLGFHGTIRDNPQVVMRVVFGPRGARQRPPEVGRLLWRGSAYDHYEAGEWRHGKHLFRRSMPVLRRDGLYVVNYAPGLDAKSTPATLRHALLRQEIYLEPLSSRVLFGLDRPVAVEVPARRITGRPMFRPRRGPLGEIHTARPRASGVRYIVYSKPPRPTAERLRQAGSPGGSRWRRFLQLPADLSPRVRALARRITAGAKTRYDKALAIQRHLQQNYRYTLELARHDAGDPIEGFLFSSRRGHCEYFATAMTLLLRAVGVHARHVNGFVGGRWNAYGRYLAVRQGDAHTWTEVLFSNVGWVAFDATPPQRASLTHSSWWQQLDEIFDTLRLRWFSYVVEYDLTKQLSLLKKASHWVRGAKTPPNRSDRPPDRALRWPWIAGSILALVALVLLWRRRRGRPIEGPLHPASRSYRRALAILARAEIIKPPSSTPREFATEQLDMGHRWAPLLAELTDCYYALRFGQAASGEPEAQRLRGLVSALRQTVKQARKGGPEQKES